jgi:membrane protein DedA with SNARE-associated domain
MLEALVIRWGYWAIGLGAFLEGESILVAAGALAHRGLLSLPLVMLSAFLGSVTGDQVWFQLGRRFGQGLLERRPKWKSRVGAVQHRLDRHGTIFVFGFRFIYGVRTITPALLGLSGYPATRFVLLNVAGAGVWVVVVASAGWALGAALAGLLQRAAHVEELLAAALISSFVVWFVWRHLHHRGASGSPPNAAAP